MNEAYICPCCGGHVNPVTLKCEFCGVAFKKEGSDILRIETYRNPVRTFRAGVRLDRFLIHELGMEEASKIAVENLTKELSKSIPLCMTVHEDCNLDLWARTYYGEIKMIEPLHVGVNTYDH